MINWFKRVFFDSRFDVEMQEWSEREARRIRAREQEITRLFELNLARLLFPDDLDEARLARLQTAIAEARRIALHIVGPDQPELP